MDFDSWTTTTPFFPLSRAARLRPERKTLFKSRAVFGKLPVEQLFTPMAIENALPMAHRYSGITNVAILNCMYVYIYIYMWERAAEEMEMLMSKCSAHKTLSACTELLNSPQPIPEISEWEWDTGKLLSVYVFFSLSGLKVAELGIA